VLKNECLSDAVYRETKGESPNKQVREGQRGKQERGGKGLGRKGKCGGLVQEIAFKAWVPESHQAPSPDRGDERKRGISMSLEKRIPLTSKRRKSRQKGKKERKKRESRTGHFKGNRDPQKTRKRGRGRRLKKREERIKKVINVSPKGENKGGREGSVEEDGTVPSKRHGIYWLLLKGPAAGSRETDIIAWRAWSGAGRKGTRKKWEREARLRKGKRRKGK